MTDLQKVVDRAADSSKREPKNSLIPCVKGNYWHRVRASRDARERVHLHDQKKQNKKFIQIYSVAN